MILSSKGCKVSWELRAAAAGGRYRRHAISAAARFAAPANAGPQIANRGKADRGRCTSPEPLYRRCFQIDSIARTPSFHFASIVSVIPQPPPQEIPATFQGLGFPNLLPIVPNRRCLRATITFLFACQVYICEVSGRCSRSTAPARLATNALLCPVTNCNIFGIGNKRSRRREDFHAVQKTGVLRHDRGLHQQLPQPAGLHTLRETDRQRCGSRRGHCFQVPVLHAGKRGAGL